MGFFVTVFIEKSLRQVYPESHVGTFSSKKNCSCFADSVPDVYIFASLMMFPARNP